MTPKRFQRRAPVKGTHNRIYVGALAVAAGSLYVAVKTISESHRRNESLSLNCLNSSVWSDRSSVMARSKALSCSIRAFCWSELAIAFWYALFPGNLRRQLLGDHLLDLVLVLPLDVAEVVIEVPDDD